jgi:hypothetical protein
MVKNNKWNGEKKIGLIEIWTVAFIKSINLNRKLNMNISVITHYIIILMDKSSSYILYNIV